jgi:hypothetical protein
MARKSNAALAMQANTVNASGNNEEVELTSHMRAAVEEIDQLFGDAQAASLSAYWQIGKKITEVSANAERYLTEAQRSNHIDPAALLISLFAPVYSADQLRGAEAFYDKYPTERQLERLLEMRCPDRPRWRITTSHVQLLTQISDDDQRQALEEKCAEEGLPAKTLATELQELKGGKTSKGGRKHQAPKGIKNQLHDLLSHLQRFIGRSQTLWLGDENIYDELVNTSPSKRDDVVMSHFRDIVEKLTELSDVVGDHIAMANRAMESLEPTEEDEADSEETEETEETDTEEDSDTSASARRAAAAAAAARRKSRNITR